MASAEAASIFSKSGGLKGSVIKASKLIIPGNKLGQSTQQYLLDQGGNIADWGKYETKTFKSPYGNFKVHFYYNSATGEPDYWRDYKVKFDGMTEGQ